MITEFKCLYEFYPPDEESSRETHYLQHDDPSFIAWGETQSEARKAMKDLIIDVMKCCVPRKELFVFPVQNIPKPENNLVIKISYTEAMKGELINAFVESGITKKQLAQKLGIPVDQVNKLLNPLRFSTLDSMVAAFEVLGKKVNINIE